MANTVKTALLLGLLTALVLLIGSAFGEGGLLVAFVIALVMNVGSYWFADRLVLRMYHATEVGPDHVLARITARLAAKAGLPMPRVYVIPDPSPNAFATGRNPHHAAVAATEGILELLSEPELEGVIAHELSHVKHRDILISSVAAMIAATVMMLANMARFAAFFGVGRDDRQDGPSPVALLATALLAPVAAMLIQMAISRQREFAADRSGADLVGSPDGLASALRRIESAVRRVPMDANPATAHLFIMKPFSTAGLLSLFSSHPPTDARIRALVGERSRLESARL
jgi:heat shock protein HtpX